MSEIHASHPTEPIDREILGRLTGGDPAFLREVVSTFVEELLERLPRLQRAVDTADAAAVALESHSIKGSALSVGAMVLARAALTIETRSRGGALDGVPELARVVADEVDRIEKFAASRF